MLIFIQSLIDFQNLAKNKNINFFETETQDFENLNCEYQGQNKIKNLIYRVIERHIKKTINIDKETVYVHVNIKVDESQDKDKKTITFKTKVNYI
jgi:hypothetical protein